MSNAPLVRFISVVRFTANAYLRLLGSTDHELYPWMYARDPEASVSMASWSTSRGQAVKVTSNLGLHYARFPLICVVERGRHIRTRVFSVIFANSDIKNLSTCKIASLFRIVYQLDGVGARWLQCYQYN